jgi:hypothetical protein
VSASSLAFYLTQCNVGTFAKKPLGGYFDQMVLERLDRLTLDEGRITASQILKVVYGFVQNMRVVMDGEQTDSACHPLALRILPLDGKSFMDGIWDALGMFASANELSLGLTQHQKSCTTS